MNLKSVATRLFLIAILSFTGTTSYAKTLIESLQTQTPEIFTDATGVGHKLYFSTSHPEFLNLIEESLSDLSETPLGRSLFQYVLGCDSQAISRHFGISTQKGIELSSNCFRHSKTENRNPYILESQNEKVETKLSVVPGTSQRQYVLVISDRLNWSVDSWTDPISNKTVFIIGKEQANKSQFKAFFYQMMAHELAIYFDTKAWVGSVAWNEVPRFKSQLMFAAPDTKGLTLALNNPLISQLLRSLRAFKTEKIFISQLVNMGRLSPEILDEYNKPDADYFSDNCFAPCIFSFVKIYSKLLLPQSLPLLSFSPQYRSQKILEVLSHTGDYADLQKVSRVLERNSESYLQQVFNNDPFFNMITPELTAQQRVMFRETAEVFQKTLLPEDLATISNLVIDPSPFGRAFLEFLAEPQLGGKNVRLSGGPRPRIRPWGYTSQDFLLNLQIDRTFIRYFLDGGFYLERF